MDKGFAQLTTDSKRAQIFEVEVADFNLAAASSRKFNVKKKTNIKQ